MEESRKNPMATQSTVTTSSSHTFDTQEAEDVGTGKLDGIDTNFLADTTELLTIGALLSY